MQFCCRRWEKSVRKTHGALLWTLLLLAAVSARAEVVADLHAAIVPVDNQSSETLTAAAREALADVLVKVSGSRELLQSPAIVSALNDARSHVQQYSYVRRTPPATGLALRCEFDAPFITSLVKRAGAPLWTANRPTVLAWVMVEDEQGRHFISKDSAPEEMQVLLEEFSRRGVPVQLPLFDLADTTAVNPDDAWNLDTSVMQAASARYNVQDILIGRLASASEGQSVGEWSYLHDDQHSNRPVTVPDLTTFLREGVNLAAGELAARYAVALTGGGGGIRVIVTGVTSYEDYAAIVRWLEGLELVDHATIDRVQGDRIELRLQAQADAAHLATTIELNNRLVPVAVPATPPESGAEPGAAPEAAPEAAPASSGQLIYQWRK
jgi:uncharacterized protein